MKYLNVKLAILFLSALLLAACGETQDQSATEPPAAEPKPSNNPFAREQQLIQDAKGVQDMLDQNATKKKEAMDAAN